MSTGSIKPQPKVLFGLLLSNALFKGMVTKMGLDKFVTTRSLIEM